MAVLIAVLAVLSLRHVALARYDLQAMELVNCIFDESGTASCDESGDGTAAASPDATASTEPAPSLTPDPSASSDASATPAATLPPWDGKERLNILLIGSDQRPKEGTYNTDTLIVVSVDPTTGQVAMFSLPRDTVDVPIPPGPARNVFGRVYAGKVNAFYSAVARRPDLYPGTDETRPDWIDWAYQGLAIPRLNDIPPERYRKYRKYVDNGAAYIFVQPSYYPFFHAKKSRTMRKAYELDESIVELFLQSTADSPVMQFEQEQQRNEKNVIEYLTTEEKLVILVLPRNYSHSSNFEYAKSRDEYARYLNGIANGLFHPLYGI